jgi:membrane-bound lytic murein transglycosylase A
MPLRQLLLLLLVIPGLAITAGCHWGRARKPAAVAKDYAHQLESGESGLTEVDSAQLPDLRLNPADRQAIDAALANSLAFLAKPGASHTPFPTGITREDVERSCRVMREVLAASPDDAGLNRAIRERFRVLMSVGCDSRGTVLFTGYYTPIFDGSLTPGGRFQYPLIKRPADLVPAAPLSDDLAQQRLPDGSLKPYPTRAELEQSGALKGHELVWLADPFEAYIVQVQGSGKIRLPGGEVIDVGFDGTNNHRYHAIAEDLIAEGRIRKEELSLATMRAYFKAHPDEVAGYTARNPRYVFFTRTKGGPFGSLGQPVTRDVTVATDKSIFPRAAPVIVATTTTGADGSPVPYNAIRVDQDTGGAIRAPGRCDLYMGEGPAAERRAGFQYAEGKLFYLIAR